MLPLEDGGVVDPSLKVYGTSNIRVADTSIIPLHVGAHIQGTKPRVSIANVGKLTSPVFSAFAYVIGERGTY